MLLLLPKFIILDELDSGVDIDSLQTIFNAILHHKTNEMSFLIITHSLKSLKFFNEYNVHIMQNGQIVKSGTQELALHIENFGYKSIIS